MEIYSDQGTAALSVAANIVDQAWEELRNSPYVQSRVDSRIAQLPDLSFAAAQRRSNRGHELLKALSSLDQSGLPHDLILTLRLVEFCAHTWSREADWYWTVIDPLGCGFFGLFLPTAYCGGSLLNWVHQQLRTFVFAESGDTDRYLALVADYTRLLDQFTARGQGQTTRGILMPKAQVLQARTLLSTLKSGARSALTPSPQRLSIGLSDAFLREVEQRVATCVEPAFGRILEGLSEEYFAAAPDTVGMRQYPKGAEIYAELVRLHTTLDLTPEQIHARGLERMFEIENAIRTIAGELGFSGNSTALADHLDRDPNWRADSVPAVTEFLRRYIVRLEPHLTRYFAPLPIAPHDVAPLPESLQGAMTFGYYDEPKKDRAAGLYLFNAKNLTRRPLFNAAAVIYHELMPGHHLHLATQSENEALTPFRAHSFINAYNEGWAEYAATFVGEIGLYEQPEERFGRLAMDAFLTSRLVVDTGMNAMGWSLERAGDYMREHSRLPESEILTELVRYSADIPGQSLAYKLGDTHILALRERMRSALGESFDLKGFHGAILRPGALPLTLLEWHIEHEIQRLGARRPA